MRICVVFFFCFLDSVAIASETDPRPNSTEKLKHWRRVKFAEYDPPAIATQQSPPSALGNREEHENDGGVRGMGCRCLYASLLSPLSSFLSLLSLSLSLSFFLFLSFSLSLSLSLSLSTHTHTRARAGSKNSKQQASSPGRGGQRKQLTRSSTTKTCNAEKPRLSNFRRVARA